MSLPWVLSSCQIIFSQTLRDLCRRKFLCNFCSYVISWESLPFAALQVAAWYHPVVPQVLSFLLLWPSFTVSPGSFSDEQNQLLEVSSGSFFISQVFGFPLISWIWAGLIMFLCRWNFARHPLPYLIWTKIPEERSQHLVESMPHRIKEVLKGIRCSIRKVCRIQCLVSSCCISDCFLSD